MGTATNPMETAMNQKIVQFRSKSEREQEVDLLAKYREIGIAAIAAANHAFRKNSPNKAEARRPVIVGYAD